MVITTSKYRWFNLQYELQVPKSTNNTAPYPFLFWHLLAGSYSSLSLYNTIISNKCHYILLDYSEFVCLQKKVNIHQTFIFITTCRSCLINEVRWESNCAQITATISQFSRNTRRKSYIYIVLLANVSLQTKDRRRYIAYNIAETIMK